MAWIVQCAPEAAEILSHYGAEKHQRNSISVLVELLCTLDPPSFLCREFWYMPSTPRGSVGPIFPVWWTFLRDCVTCSSPVSMKTSAARRPEAFITNCHAYSTLPPSVWWCIPAHFLPSSQEDGVVQLPFRPALRLRLFPNGLLAPSFHSNLSSNLFLPAFRWNLRLLDSLIHSFWKSVRIPIDSLYGNQKLELKIEKLFGIIAILAQDRLWSRSPPSVAGFSVLACTRIFSRNKEIHWVEHSWTSCRSTRM